VRQGVEYLAEAVVKVMIERLLEHIAQHPSIISAATSAVKRVVIVFMALGL